MVSLDTKISRRDLLKLGGLTAASLLISTSEDSIRALINQRQHYLDELVKKEPSPYVGKVIYDHDDYLLNKFYNSTLQRIEGPKLSEFLDAMRNHPSFQNHKTSEIIDEIGKEQEVIKSQSDAVTILHPFDYDQGKKSDIVFFPRAFHKTLVVETEKGDVKIPIEERLKGLLRHEYSHAKQNYQGITLGKELSIDSSNFHKIHPFVRSFVRETETYLEMFRYSKQFGKNHPQDLLASLSLSLYVEETVDAILKMKLTPYESKLIQVQMDKLLAIEQELIDYLKDVGTLK